MKPDPTRPRRLPRPAGTRAQTSRPRPPAPAEAEQAPVVEIAQLIERVCAISHLGRPVVISDWLGMAEAAMRRQTLNLKAYALTGQFVPDPPDVADIFRRARERYIAASRTYPATYREMQTAFSRVLALLETAAQPGLEAYVRTGQTPDIIGQVFLACVNPGPAWWPFFPSWPEALAAARALVPNGPDQILERLIRAGLDYRQDTPNPIHPEPGDRFQEWFLAVLPYVEPLIFGPTVISSSAMLLALAAQFQDWARHWGLVRFYVLHPEPLLERMMSLNERLYGLNGYAIDLITTHNDLIDHYQDQMAAAAAGPPPPAETEPVPDRDEIPSPRLDPRVVTGRGPSFEELFRK